MAKTIKWNKKALEKLEDIMQYLEEEISEEAVRAFITKLANRIDILAKYPEIGRKSNKKKTIRSFKIDKYKNLYYRIHGRNLIIVYIFDVRQDPDKNPYNS